jgi:hypothetical protein
LSSPRMHRIDSDDRAITNPFDHSTQSASEGLITNCGAHEGSDVFNWYWWFADGTHLQKVGGFGSREAISRSSHVFFNSFGLIGEMTRSTQSR